MKKTLVIFLSVLFFIALAGCDNGKNESNTKNGDELYLKAIAILDELSRDQRVKDFRKAYDLLMTLPSDKEKFISQLGEVNEIYEKYGVELNSGDYYLLPKNTIAIDQEGINKYRNRGAYYDANDLLDAIVYPVLFEMYGNEAQSIKGTTADKVISAIKSTNDYTFDEKTEQYDGCKEFWEFAGVPKCKYEVKYHNNGLVESVKIPIVRSDNPLSDAEYTSYFEKDIEEQKQIAGNRFMSMNNQFSTISTGYEVLSQIFTDEEITVISNYIHSLTIEEIWERNLFALTGEPTTYVSAIVVFDYKGNNISIDYGLNDIALNVKGNNIVNPLSNRWYTLWCGLCLPEGSDETISTYSDYINNNTAVNDIVQDYSFNLNTNADRFTKAAMPNTEQTQGRESTQIRENVTSLKIDTEYYTIEVPNSWNEDSFYKITDGELYSYTLSFYDKASYEETDGGWLFSIRLEPEFENYSGYGSYGSYDILGSLEVYRIGSYNIVVLYPTDVQYSDKTAENYREMSGSISDILDTISFKDECTFSKDPIPVQSYSETHIISRANGSWSHSVNAAESQNLIIRSDGTFIMTYNSYGEIKEMITGSYEIISDDGKYQQFCFYSSNAKYTWSAKIFQTNLTDEYGTQYDGIEYISESGEILYYTGVKYAD